MNLRKLIQEEVKRQLGLVEENRNRYAEVIFMQDSEADEVLEIIDRDGEERAIEYLSQWDYGDYYEIHNDFRKVIGRNDMVFETENYVLAYNKYIGYVSLYAKI